MPLGGWWLVASSGMLAVAAWAIRWAWACALRGAEGLPETGVRGATAWLRLVMPTIASGLALVAISTPASGAMPLAAAWLAWLASEGAAWYLRPGVLFARRCQSRGMPPAASPLAAEGNRPPVHGSALKDAATTTLGSCVPEDDSDLVPPNLMQQVTRLSEEEGERVHALAKVAIEAGDCLGVLHLAFGPPLASHPKLTACVVDEPQASVRVTDAEIFGARVEVRLPQPALQSRAVWVEVQGLAPSPRGGAGARPSS
jgi:hypothetical protein